MTERGTTQLDHTADLALEIRAESEGGLYEEGARAIVEILTEGATLEEGAERRVQIDALDGDDRFVQWLNEVLFVALTGGFLTARAEVVLENDEGNGLTAVLHGMGDAGHRIATELKSVTYHDLSIEQVSEGWRARVVIDV